MPKKRLRDDELPDALPDETDTHVRNPETNRYCLKTGALGKQIMADKKIKQMEKEVNQQKVRRMKDLVEAEQEKQDLVSENKRLNSLVVPSLMAAFYTTDCKHSWEQSRVNFADSKSRVCGVCGALWKLIPKSEPQAKSERFLSAMQHVAFTTPLHSPYMDKLAEEELHEAAEDCGLDVNVKMTVTEETTVLRRVGKSGLKSGLTGDFGNMHMQAVKKEEDAGEEGQSCGGGAAGSCGRK